VRFPIAGAFHGVAFYDAGNVYRTLPDFDPFDLRHVLGAGIRLETPIGPLRAEYGWKLDRETGEEPGKFFFSIGNAF
jgi:outer membrane protein insertion porin family